MRMFRPLLVTLFFTFISLSAAFAVNPGEVLNDPALEARARQISSQLRCLVCQNQSIDISDADLAKDLRIIVRERLTAGDTDRQVFDYVVARYGEFVLLKPSFSTQNLILWGAPFALVLIGGAVMFLASRRRAKHSSAPSLSAEEQSLLDEILREKESA
jgi:cytochrome c-type biogenesis protein CcmH